MRKILVFFSIFFFSFHNLQADESFAYLSASTSNIGDDFQAIAAKRLLPKGHTHIDKELISQAHFKGKIHTIVNGWLIHTKDCCWWGKNPAPLVSWPPSDCINPLLISIYFSYPSFYFDTLTQEGIDYMKEHGPVGARDLGTLEELEKRGIPAYFSGCLSLTLDNPFEERDDIIYAIDIPKETVDYIRSKTNSKVVVVSHGVPKKIQYKNGKRLKYAKKLLNQYRRAKCVVTTRLHAAMPCLAFETPVLFFAFSDAVRMKGLADLTHHCTSEELLNDEVDFDFNSPPENPKTYLALRENLIKAVTQWVKDQSEN